MNRKSWWGNTPAFFTTARKKLDMSQAFEVETKSLVQSKLTVTIPRGFVGFKIGLCGMKFFCCGAELLPRALCGEPTAKTAIHWLSP